jgi:hypothetical protein
MVGTNGGHARAYAASTAHRSIGNELPGLAPAVPVEIFSNDL